MSLWSIVPARGLAAGKSRLAGILEPAERMALNTLLLERALAAVEAADGKLAHCIVVSAGADALALAREKGAVPLKDPGEPGGLNAAVEAARNLARILGATTLRVLAADLPDVSGAALVALGAAVPASGVVIVADKHGSGTNALMLPAGSTFRFDFGEDSLARHQAAARALGAEPLVWHVPELAFDLDSPEDYRQWQARVALRP